MVITFKNVYFSYTDIPLLNDVSFSFTDNDKIGLVGFNGCGKSTILKLIIGEENPKKGEIIKSGNMLINYLPQEPYIPSNIKLIDYLLHTDDLVHPINEYEAKTILTKFKLDPNQTTNHLSGGERKRLALGKCLLTYCDILLLDEPTNHLDNDMIIYLEKLLAKFNHGVFMVTHDRYFLERCCNNIYELDNAKIYTYKANYSKFLELKEERLLAEAKEERKIKSILKNDLEWMNQGAEARRTKQKYRIQRFEKMSEMKFAQRKDFSFESVKTYLGKNIIEIIDGSKAYNDKILFKHFNLSVLRSDHIGITGNNGCGKTTLFKIIMQQEKLDSGELLLGETVRIGYFSQHFDEMDPKMKVIDYIMKESNDIETLDGNITARSLLEKFLFDSRLQYSSINTLSGGQKRRLQLVKVLARNPNVLLLDEPTNDLDIYTLEVLEDYLNSFVGPVLCVSHDRFFLDSVCDKMLYYDQGEIKCFNGSFSELLERDLFVKEINDKSNIDKREKKERFSFNDQRKLNELEIEIPKMESRLKELNEELCKVTTDYQKILELDKELKELNDLYESKSNIYLELLEKKENLSK